MTAAGSSSGRISTPKADTATTNMSAADARAVSTVAATQAPRRSTSAAASRDALDGALLARGRDPEDDGRVVAVVSAKIAIDGVKYWRERAPSPPVDR